MVQYRAMHEKIALALLQSALERSWSQETSAAPNWSRQNPAQGQCAVTALIVQDFFGGRLLKTKAQVGEGISHIYNELPNGVVVDLTASQFPKGTLFSTPDYRVRDSVFERKGNRERYELLKKRVLSILIPEKGEKEAKRL